jgi:hypothetical protein
VKTPVTNETMMKHMKMARKSILLGVAVTITCTGSFALLVPIHKGIWPGSWPKELEPLRAKATTVEVANGLCEHQYLIPFHTREEFVTMWPYLLKAKSKGAPLILENGPLTNSFGQIMASGVRILAPADCRVNYPNGRLFAGEPWPDSIKSPKGALPEFVIGNSGTWVPFPGPGGFRARVDIVLVMDANIVNTNHVRIPADTPIVDKRARR